MSLPKCFRLKLGQIVATPGAIEYRDQLRECIARHERGDWGEVCDEDKAANNAALKYGSRVLSAYSMPDGVKLWVITEADRSVTTFLLPEERVFFRPFHPSQENLKMKVYATQEDAWRAWDKEQED